MVDAVRRTDSETDLDDTIFSEGRGLAVLKPNAPAPSEASAIAGKRLECTTVQ